MYQKVTQSPNVDEIKVQTFASLPFIITSFELNNVSILYAFGLDLKYTDRYFCLCNLKPDK